MYLVKLIDQPRPKGSWLTPSEHVLPDVVTTVGVVS